MDNTKNKRYTVKLDELPLFLIPSTLINCCTFTIINVHIRINIAKLNPITFLSHQIHIVTKNTTKAKSFISIILLA